MKKLLLTLPILAVIVAALGTAGSVYAQASTPSSTVPGTGYGTGFGGRGARGGMMGGFAGTQDGLLHDELIAAYADKLGISVDDLNARLAGGETLSQIALSTGMTLDEFQSMLTDARSEAISAAVANGTLTQDQADWMTQRAFGAAAAAGRGMRGAGTGAGQFANPGCPYYQTTP